MRNQTDVQTITIIVPILNEIARVPDILSYADELGAPVILVDGGSTDGTLPALKSHGLELVKIVQTACGRGLQMNAGAAMADTDSVLFLHADTRLPSNGLELIIHALNSANTHWGRFDVSFDNKHLLLRMIAWFMNTRSAVTGICTGDQAIFMTRNIFLRAGGFPEISLMEDIEISKRLKKISDPIRLASPVTTSARRWLDHGIIRTVLKMWWLRFRYWLGDDPEKLSKKYQI